MVIAITRENGDMINYVCDVLCEDVQILNGVSSLKRFALKEVKNLNNYSHIIIDLNGLNDTEDELHDGIVALKSMYKMKIIVMALENQYSTSLLSNLFREGIYNFVISSNEKEQKRDLIYCIQTGMQYKDAIKYCETNVNNCIENNQTIDREYKKVRQITTIGIAGTRSHIGVTTHALAITKFLNDLKMNACYIQANESTDIETLEIDTNISDKKELFNISGIDIYKKDKSVSDMKYGYDFYVYDMGVLDEIKNIEDYRSKDVKILISGTKNWEQLQLMNSFDILGDLKNINYIFNFTPDNQKEDIKFSMRKFGTNVFFSNYMPNPFEIETNKEEYSKLLNDYIEEKHIKVSTVQTEKKRGLLWRLINES